MASTSSYPGFPAYLALYCENGSAIIEGDALKQISIIGKDTIIGTSPGSHAVAVATGGTRSVIPMVNSVSAREISEYDVYAMGAPEEWGVSHARQIADFVKCCRSGEPPLVDGLQARASVELILAAYQSAKSGRPVDLPK
jgi:predicted dehydrogenase